MTWIWPVPRARMLPGAVMLPEDTAAMAVALAEKYEQGWTLRKLANETERSVAWVHDLIHSVGLERGTWQRRLEQCAGRTRLYLTGPEKAAAAAEIGPRYEAGETLYDLAQSTGLSESTVGRLVRLSGVRMRSRWEVPRRP